MATLGALLIELFLADAWVDVSGYVLEQRKFTIMRGEVDEHGRLKTTSLSLSLRNDKPGFEGIWSNANPSSPYFGLLVPGVPIRITRGTSIRCVLQVRKWDPDWSHASKGAYVAIVATGPLGQSAQGSKMLESPIFRDVMRKNNDQYRLGYWPMEEESDATRFTSPMDSLLPLTVQNFNSIDLSAFESPGSRNLPILATGVSISADIPNYVTSEHKITQLWDIPSTLPTSTVLCRFFCSGGTVAWFDLIYSTAGSGSLRLIAYDSNGALLDQTALVNFQVNAKHFLTSTEWTQVGADIETTMLVQPIDIANPSNGNVWDETFSSLTVGKFYRVTMAPNGDLDGIAVGHLGVANDIAGLAFLQDACVAHIGEPAGTRILRLLSEEGITASVAQGSASLTEPMGLQDRSTLLDLLTACTTVDQGILRENRTVYQCTYVPGYTMQNQAVTLALDYDQSHFGPAVPKSSTDDFLVHNDVTVRRPSGGRGNYRITEGRLSVDDPPDGIGTYDRGPVTAETEDDDQLPDLASWIANIRSPLDARWPSIELELSRAGIDADLADDILGTLISQVISLANMPIFVAPETHYAILRGWRELGDKFTHRFQLYTTPYWPYEVEPVETSGSALTIAQTAGSTSWLLATTSGPLWDITYEPYHIQAGGEAVRVTAMADNTVTFVGAGTADSDDNASLTPTIHASTTDGDLMFLIASIRNAGVGTVDTPANWQVIGDLGNFKVFTRYFIAGAAAPTVTFTGGVAGATTNAVILTYRGVSRVLDEGRYLAALTGGLNAASVTAQNMDFAGMSVREPGALVLVAFHKLDDYTSVAPAAGFTEAVEVSSTLGDDASLYAMHQIQTSATDVAAGSVVVTGGASAASESITLVLRRSQTATVVRGVNGVNVAQAADAAVTTWRLGVNAL